MSQIQEAIKVLKHGGVVVYPTDTAYGLAVDATNAEAVKKLFQLKGRNFKNPIHVVPPTRDSIGLFGKNSRLEKKIINELMPGPITLVVPLKAKSKSWQLLSAGTKTIGIRRPKNKIALDLAMLLGKPITTTSANVSGQSNTYSIVEVKKQFSKSILKPDFYLDGGKLKKTQPSTVVLLDKNNVKILREGPISERKIKQVLGL
jgi:L-threonylcarbamoyladenylate synthase